VYGIQGDRFEHGKHLSAAAESGIAEVVDQILKELARNTANATL
jgi:Ni,Fe-hydrogenase maturation factor